VVDVVDRDHDVLPTDNLQGRGEVN
jgi:hypothetical protein